MGKVLTHGAHADLIRFYFVYPFIRPLERSYNEKTLIKDIIKVLFFNLLEFSMF